jgi:hypothetical protein
VSMFGDPEETAELFNTVTDPKAPAELQIPFLAGLIHGMMKNLYLPMTLPKGYVEFIYSALPAPFCTVTLQNGDVIKITIEKVEQ